MFLKVKRLKQIDDVLFEANIIKFGDQFNDLSDEYSGNGSNKTDTTGQENETAVWNKFDVLIDSLLAQGIVDLDRELQRPIYEKELGSARGKEITQAYLNYCKVRIERLKTEMSAELTNPDPDKDKIQSISRTIIEVAARIEALDKIYLAFKALQQSELTSVADEINAKITELKQSLTGAYMEPINTTADSIKKEMLQITDGEAPLESKLESSKNVLCQFGALNKAIENYPPEVKEGAKEAKAKIDHTIKQAIGEENFANIEEEILTNDHEANVLKRILDMRHRNFTSEDEIYKEADGIKISINGLKNPKGKARSKPEVIAFLEKQLAEVTGELLQKAKDKSLSLNRDRGIHYDFNVMLKLHQVVDLPVTGKQIADASWVMKFRKRLASILDLLVFGGDIPVTAAYQAFSNFGQAVHKAYAVSLNTTAKLIGKAINGREGEMKADAISRMFIPNPDVVDNKPTSNVPIPTKLTEDAGPGVAPGVSMQTPASISGMGPISAPTRTSFGSGDKFSSGHAKHRRKKKKRMGLYENQVKVMSFSAFINESTESRSDKFNVGDTVMVRANSEELQDELFQAIDGALAVISEIYRTTYEPDVDRFEVTLKNPVKVNGSEIKIVPGLYIDNIERYRQSTDSTENEAEVMNAPRGQSMNTIREFNESLEEAEWYFGMADCLGIESFVKEPFAREWEDVDTLFDIGLLPVNSSTDPEKQKYNVEIGMMVRRAHANQHRWPVVFRVKLDSNGAKQVNDMIKHGDYEMALIALKDNAITTQVARGIGGDPERRWNSIPNPELDPM